MAMGGLKMVVGGGLKMVAGGGGLKKRQAGSSTSL